MQDPFKDFGEVFFSVCKGVDTPRSLAYWLAFKYRSSDLFSMAPSASDYDSPDSFAVDYLCHSYVKKLSLEWPGIDRVAVALGGFTSAERQCAETNERLRASLRGYFPRENSLLQRASRKIANLLGPFDLASVLEHCRWGPGATALVERRRSRPDLKQSACLFSVTASSLPLFKLLVESDPSWVNAILACEVSGPVCLVRSVFDVIDYNVVITVPKDAQKERTIAKEPAGNSYLQQGVGRFLRTRLKRVGINLDDQGLNQSWASLAHDLGLATLDLSMASDSLSISLVDQLLPVEWSNYLHRLRTPYGKMPDGSRIRYNKFSSMGNAFTFELESLIFWALCSACCDDSDIVSVYGDDIIVPSARYDSVVSLLAFCGFQVNSGKSYHEGLFFESCGKHYFDGVDVTPAYQKEPPRGSLFSRIHAHNRLMRWALRLGGDKLHPGVRSACELLRRGNHSSITAPLYYEGDDAFIVPWEQGTWRVDEHGTVRFTAFRPKRLRRKTVQRGALSLWFHSRREDNVVDNVLRAGVTASFSVFYTELDSGVTRKTSVIGRPDMVNITW